MQRQIPAIVILLILVISCVGGKEELNCDQFRQGKFLFRGQISKSEYQVDRIDSLQIEIDSTSRMIFRKKINWLSDCEYELRFINGQSMDTSADGGIRIVEAKSNLQRIKIISAAKDYYIFETNDKDNQPYKDTMWIRK